MEELIASDIEEIRDRLIEIQSEREQLREAETSRWEGLLDEERKLENRLADLEDRLAEEDAGMAEERVGAQTDLTRAPRLPDSKNKS